MLDSRFVVRVGLAAAVLLLPTGCTGSKGAAPTALTSTTQSSAPAPTSSGTASPQSFDPPTAFAADRGVRLPIEAAGVGRQSKDGTVYQPLPVALHGVTAYIAAHDNLQVVDTGSGEVKATIKPKLERASDNGGFIDGNNSPPPLVAEVDGKTVVHVAFVVRRAGKGKARERRLAELVTVDAVTGQSTGTVNVELTSYFPEHYGFLTGTVVGVSDDLAVLRVSSSGATPKSMTFGLDLRRRRTIWKREYFDGSALAGRTVVGVFNKARQAPYEISQPRLHAIGVSVSTGRTRWSAFENDPAYHVEVGHAGPSLVVIGRYPILKFGEAPGLFQIIDAARGTVRASGPDNYREGYCRYDGRSVTVCAGGQARKRWAAAFDAKTGKWLWKLSNRKRLAPVVTALWHGAVYARTKAGPVVLDARTGREQKAVPRILPNVVNEVVGIALGKPGSDVRAYPATG